MKCYNVKYPIFYSFCFIIYFYEDILIFYLSAYITFENSMLELHKRNFFI